ncbi:AMP-binding protein [Spiribacter halobius]|uniref:AMP-dependent synthetase/ligase domain-containing protein n=1 Tax=Sediminicurvatus halobius TaxID=2182432 RepID=A0A2U2N9G0_9GAMM|nr:AMP-binding protein [Spiribacter halobius]PWG65728.1 hypothetical protein DEM34_00190 [Spiribacter halobius]UEX77763.1 AMP-binding protein [Spiribacter halobius]
MSAAGPGLLARWARAAGTAPEAPAVFAPVGALCREELLCRALGAAASLAPGQRCPVAGEDVRIWLPWLAGCALRGSVWTLDPMGRSEGPPASGEAPAPGPEDVPCMALRTTGTTGPARRLLRDRGAWLRCFAAEESLLGLSPADRVLVLGGPQFSLVPYAALRALHLGAALGVLPRVRPGVARRLLTALAPTVVYGAPALVAGLARLAPAARGGPRPQRIITGGTRPTPAQIALLHSAWPGVRIATFYGTAETSFLALQPELDARDLADVGPLFPGVEAVAGAGGRLRVRTPYAALAEEGPDGAPRPLADARGWITVNDRVAVTGSGHLRLLGRADACIDAGGVLLDPAPLEHGLEALPWIEEAALVAVPDARRTTRAVAAVVTAGPPPAGARAALRRVIRGLAPAPLRVARVIGVPPRTPGGKLDRRALAAALAGGGERGERLL